MKPFFKAPFINQDRILSYCNAGRLPEGGRSV